MTTRTFTMSANFGLPKHFLFFFAFFFFILTLLPNKIFSQILYCPYCPPNWKDTIAPHAECKAAVTGYLDTLGTKYISPIVFDNFSTDNCPVIIISASQTRFTCADIGTKNVILYVRDTAGNRAQCTTRVTIIDTIRPVLTCKSNYTVRLNSAVSRVVVTPFDVAASTSDNCTPLSNLTFKMRKTGQGTGFPDSSSLSFGCGDTGRIAIEIWAKDQSDRISNCKTSIYVNDSNHICQTPIIPALLGQVATEEGRAMTAKIAVSSPVMPSMTQNSTSTGAFAFPNLVRNGDYQVTPARSGDWINGVTTFDVALISRHVLSTELFTSPYKQIAADVNRDGSIDALDMLITRRVVLRQMDSFPNNQSWCFVPKSYSFPINIDPITINFPEFLAYNNVIDTVFNADFVAIKTGDVNGNALNTPLQMGIEPRNAETFVMETEDVFLETGKTYNIVVKTPKLIADAFQFTLNYDKNALKFHAIDPIDLYNFSISNYAVFADRGKVTVSWNSLDSKAAPMNLFILKFQATQSMRLSHALSLSSDFTPAEAYSSAGVRMAVDFHIKEKSTDRADFHLFPNTPNPFKGQTQVRYRLPEESDVQLTVFDATGRILKKEKRHAYKGINEMTLDFSDTPSVSGLILYRLDTATHSATQRMMLLN